MGTDIYKMYLHETGDFDGFEIMRVAGGWIYTFYDRGDMGGIKGSVFVPFNNEFMETK